jgi:hypothetical protein
MPTARTLPWSLIRQDNYVLVDITDPANPVAKANVYDKPEPVSSTGRFVGNGNLILTSEGLGGIATIDLALPGA